MNELAASPSCPPRSHDDARNADSWLDNGHLTSFGSGESPSSLAHIPGDPHPALPHYAKWPGVTPSLGSYHSGSPCPFHCKFSSLVFTNKQPWFEHFFPSLHHLISPSFHSPPYIRPHQLRLIHSFTTTLPSTNLIQLSACVMVERVRIKFKIPIIKPNS